MAASEKRVRGIDLLRGLCIIAVVLHHTNLRIPFNNSSAGKLIGHAGNTVLFWNGYFGVRIFFVISGFLIAGWSLKRWGQLPRINMRQFYAMRFARIVPCLVGLLAILAVLDLMRVPRFTIVTHTTLPRALLAALTFHLNWLEARTSYLPAAWDVLWSLSVEEMFYFFFPIVCALSRRQSVLIAVFSVFVVAGPFARVLIKNPLWVDYSYFSCMDGIALGCLAALLAANVKFSRRWLRAFLVLGAATFAWVMIFRVLFPITALWKVGLDVTVLNIGVALLLISLQQQFDRRVANSAARPDTIAASHARFRVLALLPGDALSWFGRNSYEVYLTHMLVVWPIVGFFKITHQPTNLAPLWFLAALAIAGLLGHVVARYYSEPLNLGLRSRLIRKPLQVAEAPGTSESARIPAGHVLS